MVQCFGNQGVSGTCVNQCSHVNTIHRNIHMGSGGYIIRIICGIYMARSTSRGVRILPSVTSLSMQDMSLSPWFGGGPPVAEPPERRLGMSGFWPESLHSSILTARATNKGATGDGLWAGAGGRGLAHWSGEEYWASRSWVFEGTGGSERVTGTVCNSLLYGV